MPSSRARRRRPARRDRGAITAEVAVALPTLIVVLAASIGGVGATTTLLAANDAAADAARLIARGEAESTASAHVRAVLPGATLRTERRGDVVCGRVVVSPRVLGVPMPLTARSCALSAEAG